jgi:signal transduction histidine kinase
MRHRDRVRPVPPSPCRRPRAAWAVAAAAVLVAACCCVPLFGLVNALNNSPVEIPLLSLPFLVAYALGYETGPMVGLACIGVLNAALLAASGSFNPVGLMITSGPWIAGRIVGSRRRLADQLRARNAELLAEQEAYAAEAVRYERSRIAAELHDVVGHAMSLMVVQAGAGQRAPGDDGERAKAALELVAEAAREAQAEMSALAGLLDGDQLDPASHGAPGGPPDGALAGLDLVGELVRQARAVGLEVTYHLASDDAAVDARSAEVAGRLVTEALTNALKHAPGAPVAVDVRAVAGKLAVTVENGAARGTPSGLEQAGGGYGLAGMRDRVASRGGQFSAGPAADGGWRVHAILPALRDGPA